MLGVNGSSAVLTVPEQTLQKKRGTEKKKTSDCAHTHCTYVRMHAGVVDYVRAAIRTYGDEDLLLNQRRSAAL